MGIAIPDNPSDIGVPHNEWRRGQRSLLESFIHSKAEYVFTEIPTGTGKSGVACALGHYNNVTVCVHTLALLTQYENQYGFSVVRGKQEYNCANVEKVDAWRGLHKIVPTVADCTYSPMNNCEYYSYCPYPRAKHRATLAERSACTYRYMALSERMQNRNGFLVFDEAHDAAEELIAFNQFELVNRRLQKHKLPLFPIQEFGEDNKGDVVTPVERGALHRWLRECIGLLKVEAGDESREAATRKRMESRFIRIGGEIASDDWFLHITDKGFTVQALSARRIATIVSEKKRRKLLMSATIGKPAPLAGALGIKNYQSYSLPHPVPAKYRPVDDLGVPRMTHRNLVQQGDGLFDVQAGCIWEWVSMFPKHWRGVILTTSYYKIEQIAKRSQGRGRRLLVQERGVKVGDVVKQFISDMRDGDVMIGTIQGMGTGIDLFGDIARWLVIAGVPHVNPTDRYMKARRDKDGGAHYQRWLTYNAVVQAAGRISRGELLDDGSFMTNYVAIADGSAMTATALRFYPEWFKEAIQ